MMHHRSQQRHSPHQHHRGGIVVNPFRGGSSRLTYADPRYNKIGAGGGGGPNGGSGGGSSPRNSRWHTSSGGKCAALALTVLYLSYSTFFAPAAPPPAAAHGNLASSSSGTPPGSLLSSNAAAGTNNNSIKAEPPPVTVSASATATDGTKASSLLLPPPPPPPPAQPVDSKKETGLAEPEAPSLREPAEQRLQDEERGGGGAGEGDLAADAVGGEEDLDSRDGPGSVGAFGAEEIPKAEKMGGEDGEEEEEDDDLAGDGRPPEMRKKRARQGDDNNNNVEEEDEEDDDGRTRGERGGSEPRGGGTLRQGVGRTEGEEGDGGASKSMFQGADDRIPEGEAAAAGDGTGGSSVVVVAPPTLVGSEEASGEEAAATNAGDIPAGENSAGGDSEDNGTAGSLKAEPSDAVPGTNDGNKEEIPVVIPLPRDAVAAAVDAGLPTTAGADKEEGSKPEAPAETEGANSTDPLHDEPGDSGEGEGNTDGGKSGTAFQGLSPSRPGDVSETELSEAETTNEAELRGEEGATGLIPSTPDVEVVRGDSEPAAVDSPDEGHVAEVAGTSNATGSTEKLNISDALATGFSDTAEDALAKDLNATAASPSAPGGDADHELSTPEVEAGETPAAPKGHRESSANVPEGDKSGNSLLLDANADAATADSQEEGDGAGVPNASSTAGSEAGNTLTGTLGDSPDEGNSLPIDKSGDSATLETDEKPKDGIPPPAASSNGGTTEKELQRRDVGDPDDHGEPPRQDGVLKEDNESATSDGEVGSSKVGDGPADGSVASKLAEVEPGTAEKETEQELPAEIDTGNDPVPMQATSGDEAGTDNNEGADEQPADTASKQDQQDPVPVQVESGEESDAARLKGSELADSQKRQGGESVNDAPTEAGKHEPNPSEPEPSPNAKKGSKRRKGDPEAEADLAETTDGGGGEGGNTMDKDEETTKKSRRRKEEKGEDAERDGVDLAKETRSKKDKAKSHLRGANKDVEKTDRH